MKNEWHAFLSAVQFLTCLPVPDSGWEDGRLDRASKWFVVVGVLVGLIAGGAAALARLASLELPATLIGIIVAILVTGALHEDGLADVADSFGGRTREKRLEIMRDSRIGTYGALALVLAVMLRASVYPYLISVSSIEGLPVAMLVSFVVAHATARAGMLGVIWSLNYAREGEVPPLTSPSRGSIGFAVTSLIAIYAIACTVIPMNKLILGLVVVAFAVAFLRLLFTHKFGGWTGDAAGASCVTCEIAFLLGAAVA